MDVEQIIQLVDDQVYIKSGHYLSDLQKQLLLISLSEPRKRYEEIAQSCGYSVSYLKRDAGPKLWQLLSDICEEKVKKTNFRTILEKKIKILEQKNSTIISAYLFLLNLQKLLVMMSIMPKKILTLVTILKKIGVQPQM